MNYFTTFHEIRKVSKDEPSYLKTNVRLKNVTNAH